MIADILKPFITLIFRMEDVYQGPYAIILLHLFLEWKILFFLLHLFFRMEDTIFFITFIF